MKTSLNNAPSVVHIVIGVPGNRHGHMVTLPLESIAPMMQGLSKWKKLSRESGANWVENACDAAALLSFYFVKLAKEGRSTADFSTDESQLVNVNVELVLWLLHRLGKLGEVIGRAKHEAAFVTITPLIGLAGVQVSFRPIPKRPAAANDNTVSATFH